MNIKSRLSQIDTQLGQAKKASSSAIRASQRASKSEANAVSERVKNLQSALGGEVLSDSSGEFLLIRKFHNTKYAHGKIALEDSIRRNDYCLSHWRRDFPVKALAKRSFLFFDTETTGLGGAGAVPFLIGVGSFVRGGLETRQYIIPDFSDEAAMLERVLAEFSPETILVSYNGRAFDAPLTIDRLIIQRVARKLPFKHHLDLLHSSRSLFKRRIQDCSLGNVEAQIFGFQRTDDIPGYLVPEVYLNWIHHDDPGLLSEVIAHNRQDIVSLAMLLGIITEAHSTEGDSLTEPLDVYSFMRRAEARKDRPLAAAVSRKRGAEMASVGIAEIEYHRAMAFKRAGDLRHAVPIFEQLETGRDRFAQMARLELAKWLEHKMRDYARALLLTQKAQRFSLNHSGHKQDLALWQRRESRLKRKIETTLRQH
ncbi:ribonuclease H-like domain-containing protein [Gemmatimonas aurantiaca]|nr:ribonuclease H-like domain-containing protein [Gemmatimonas aurantiaca]